MDWFLYDRDLHHERVKDQISFQASNLIEEIIPNPEAFSANTSGFDNCHKIAVRDHVRVPKFWRTWRTYMGKYQKAYIRRHTFYLVIFLTIFPKLIHI